MRGEEEKGEVELAVFREFARKVSLATESEPEKQNPNERKPDILCILQEGPVYFELTEACAPEFAAAITKSIKQKKEIYARGNDVSKDTVAKKLRNKYEVEEPIELIVYTAGRTALPDEVIVQRMSDVFSKGYGPFRRIWFFGEEVALLASNVS